MTDERERERIVEEVAEAEEALRDLSIYTAAELGALNDELASLRERAISLSLPVTKINELKLRIAGALGDALGLKESAKAAVSPAPKPKSSEPSRPVKDRTKAVEDLFR